MFDVITLIYIYAPSWPDINTSCTVVYSNTSANEDNSFRNHIR